METRHGLSHQTSKFRPPSKPILSKDFSHVTFIVSSTWSGLELILSNTWLRVGVLPYNNYWKKKALLCCNFCAYIVDIGTDAPITHFLVKLGFTYLQYNTAMAM